MYMHIYIEYIHQNMIEEGNIFFLLCLQMTVLIGRLLNQSV